MVKILKAFLCVLIAECAGLIGAVFTTPSIPTWYAALQKPFLNPPNWVFGPVWTTLFIMMGISAFLIWDGSSALKGKKKKGALFALLIFAVQLVLNTSWSMVFFGMHLPMIAFIVIILLWLAILFTMILFYPISEVAAYLLIPYILWVSFASYLNLALWLLNR